jgi:hypothetical protein
MPRHASTVEDSLILLKLSKSSDMEAGDMDKAIPALGFLDLPAEVRVEVYQHLFHAAELSLEPAFPSVSHCGVSICPCRFPYALLSTCRTLRQEAESYLLAATTLQLASTCHKLDLLPASYLSGISRAVVLNVKQYLKQPLDFDRFAALKTLELRNIAVWCRYMNEDALWGEDGDQVMLDLAMFNIKRHSASLASLCASADRPFNILLGCRFVVSSARPETLVGAYNVDVLAH